MNFNDKLNEYIELIGCTNKQLSDITGIAPPIISCYRKGNRIPKYNSEQFKNLVNGIIKLAKEKQINTIDVNNVEKILSSFLNTENINFELFNNNFNTLIYTFKINMSDLSKFLGFDSSYVSKIKTGVRKPLNLSDFANGICKFIINNYLDTNNEQLKDLTKCSDKDLKDTKIMTNKLYFWLTNNINDRNDDYNVDSFIKKLDEFDLNDYIKAIKFDKLFTPTFPKIKTKSKLYYGLDGFKDAQLEVLKQSAFFKSKDDIFWYSNMPMVEASKDLSFTKKIMMYLAFILKKGIKLNIIHDLERPFKELMLGLEGWIPLYMTGQIKPYYLKNNSNYLYSIIECASGNAILHGECVTGNLDKCRLLVSTKKDDIIYYKENSKLLLKKASPLMNIYTSEMQNELEKIYNSNLKINNKRNNILLNLPCYTISDELLNKILDHNKINKTEKNKIYEWIKKEKDNISNILSNTTVIDEIRILSEDEFNNNPCFIDLSKFYYDKRINYNYDEYLEHIELLKKFKKNNKNYIYKINNKRIFNNINIYIIENKQVIISKVNNPITNFVIYHPILITAIQNFIAPINENATSIKK
jgi:predicted transcriptional regulator